MADLVHWMPLVLAAYVLAQASFTTNHGGAFSFVLIKVIPALLAASTIVIVLHGAKS